MHHGNLVVIFENSIPIKFEDSSDADHAKRMQLRRPQCAHAGTAEYHHSSLDREKDFLVPDGRCQVEVAIYDSDMRGLFFQGPDDVTLSCRRANLAIGQAFTCALGCKSWSEENDRLHLNLARARA